MSQLFSALTIKSITFKNRITVSPMCEYSSVDGFANHWHMVHLGSRAVGGAALILTEAAAVSPEGRISPDDLGIWKDEHIEKLAEINIFLEEQGAVAGVQLAHAGRKASVASAWKGGKVVSPIDGGWLPVAPSAIPFNEADIPPLALDVNGINKVISDFKLAAKRALKVGFKVIELHAAHGYLLHQFLSPLSNQRTDEYGGSFENRIRLLLEVIKAVQTEWPSTLPLFVRISATDWADGGWDVDQSVMLCKILKTKGVDLVDVSSGGMVPGVKIPVGPLYQAPFAARVKQEANIATGAVGLITTAQQAEELVANSSADLIFIARELLRDPYFALRAAHELGADVKWPVQYERAKRR